MRSDQTVLMNQPKCMDIEKQQILGKEKTLEYE